MTYLIMHFFNEILARIPPVNWVTFHALWSIFEWARAKMPRKSWDLLYRSCWVGPEILTLRSSPAQLDGAPLLTFYFDCTVDCFVTIVNSSVTKVYWLYCTFVPIFKENMYCYKCFGFYQLIWFDSLHISIKCLVILGWKLPRR